MALYHTVNGSPVAVNNIVIGGAETQETVTGNNTLSLPNAKANSITSVVLDGATEQSGTPTPDNPIDIVCNNGVLKVNSQGQIYTDGTTETVTVTGKNLYNPATRTNGYYIGANGVIAQGSGTFCCSALIPVKPNTAYVLSGIAGQSGQRRFHAYDSNGSWISQIDFADTATGNTYNVTGTTPNNCVYVRISIPMLDTNVQIELGSTATTYEPYFNGGTATAEMLLKVGDYKDVQSVIDGSVTRNIGIKVLNGTESWQNLSGYMSISKTDLGTNLTVLPASSANIFCTHFQVKTSSFVNGIGAGNSYVNFKYDSVFTTLTQWTQFLADQYANGTPVIVVYPLATATTETVTGQTLTVQQGANTLSATGSISTLGLSATYTKRTQLKPNYVIRNDKLVWAKPNMYLTGSVNYTVEGSPTIVDNVASGFSSDDYLSLPSLAPKDISELVFKVKLSASGIGQNTYSNLLRGPSSFQCFTYCGSSYFQNTGFNVAGLGDLYLNKNLSPDTDYWIKYTNDGTDCTAWWSEDGVNYTEGQSKPTSSITDNNSTTIRVGSRADRLAWPGTIDLNQSYIKVNGQLWFYGKNYATKNIAPVPAGYTYGTTTTSAIGWVDMRTQVFTAAPAGATIGRDV